MRTIPTWSIWGHDARSHWLINLYTYTDTLMTSQLYVYFKLPTITSLFTFLYETVGCKIWMKLFDIIYTDELSGCFFASNQMNFLSSAYALEPPNSTCCFWPIVTEVMECSFPCIAMKNKSTLSTKIVWEHFNRFWQLICFTPKSGSARSVNLIQYTHRAYTSVHSYLIL